MLDNLRYRGFHRFDFLFFYLFFLYPGVTLSFNRYVRCNDQNKIGSIQSRPNSHWVKEGRNLGINENEAKVKKASFYRSTPRNAKVKPFSFTKRRDGGRDPRWRGGSVKAGEGRGGARGAAVPLPPRERLRP